MKQRFPQSVNFPLLHGSDCSSRVSLFCRRIACLTALLVLTVGSAYSDEAVLTDCRIDAGPCTRSVRSLQVTFDVLPKPVKVMKELTFSVMVLDNGKPVNDASVSVDLTMPGMVMGTNTVMLQRLDSSAYEGKGVIVRCPSGKKLWKATVAVRRGELES